MKIAELHNGTQIHFPDETPDHEIDATVQRHLGIALAPHADNALRAILAAVSQHMGTQDAAQAGTQQLADARDNHNRNIDQNFQGALHNNLVQTMRAGHQMQKMTTQELIESLAPAIGHIAGNSDKLIVALNNISATIIEAVKAYIEAKQAPIDFTRDEKGTAISAVPRRPKKR